MKKYILVALCLVAFWGCSDDKMNNPNEKNYFPLVGGVSFYDRDFELDTLGKFIENESICKFNENHNRLLRYEILQGTFEIIFPEYESQDMGFELETAEPTALLQEDFKNYFGDTFPKHKKYDKYYYNWDELPIRQGYFIIDTSDLSEGLYILKSFKEGIQVSCKSAIYSKKHGYDGHLE